MLNGLVPNYDFVSGARGNEIVIRPEVMKLCFDESLLKPEMIVKAVRAAPHVGSYDAELPHVQIIQAEFGGDSNAPVRWFERPVAMKKIEREAQRLIEEFLLAFAKEIGTAGPGAAYVTRRRHAAPSKDSLRRTR